MDKEDVPDTSEQTMLENAMRQALLYMTQAERKEVKAHERTILYYLAKHSLIEALEQTDSFVRMLEHENERNKPC